MAIVALPDFGADPVSITGPGLDAKVNPLATDYNGNIDNTNIVSGAAIANSKLNLASVAQAVTMTGGLTISTTALTMSSMPLNEAKGADIASATTPNITSATGNMIHITGTTTITGFATGTAGIRRILVFDGALTFTHNATSLILPTGANITTVANDTAIMVSEGSGNWRCIAYYRKDGTALSSAITAASQTEMEAGTNNTKTVTALSTNWHPGVSKAWCVFNGTGTPAMVSSYNFDSSITDTATGKWVVAFTTDFSSGNYSIVGSAQETGAGNTPGIIGILNGTTPGVGSVEVCCQSDNSSYVDSPRISLVAFGDQ